MVQFAKSISQFNMCESLEDLQKPYKICRVDNCGFRIKAKVYGFGPKYAVFHLLAKACPHAEVYKISLGRLLKIETPGCDPIIQDFYEIDWSILNEFIISWYGSVIRVGVIGKQNVFEFRQEKKFTSTVIGFAKLTTMTENDQSELRLSDWIFESQPAIAKVPRSLKINGGKLHWRSLNGDRLPANAVIGGFHNELVYVARAKHGGSLCPGKYVHSERCTFIAWGYNEHRKDNFEILCGINYKWVKCEGRNIPENAIIGGMSQLNNDPLYIGRAKFGSDVICGKVHVLYGTCYIPYNGNEIEYNSYEILVTPDIPPRRVQDSHCFCVNR